MQSCGLGVGFEVFGGLRVGYELSETCIVRGNLFRDTSKCCAEPCERQARDPSRLDKWKLYAAS